MRPIANILVNSSISGWVSSIFTDQNRYPNYFNYDICS
nr:MAG TPA: hypothetical protein [Bacteriophage sp.]